MKIEFDTRNFEKSLNKVIEEKNRQLQIESSVSDRKLDSKMVILNKTEEELLRILIDSLDKEKGFEFSGNYPAFPSYILSQLNELLYTLKFSGYVASFSIYFGHWSYILTPIGLTYFEDKTLQEEQSKEIGANSDVTTKTDKANSIFNINNLTAKGSNVVLGNMHNSNQSIDNSVVNKTKEIEPKLGFIGKLFNHLSKHGWFYGAVLTIIAAAVFFVLSQR